MSEQLFPFILIYKVGPVLKDLELQEKVSEFIHSCFDSPVTKRPKYKGRVTNAEMEEEKEVEHDTDSDNPNFKLEDSYKKRSVTRSLLNTEKKSKRKTNFSKRGCCF
jgi:hypothetical protein